jgi:hypothetical protein
MEKVSTRRLDLIPDIDKLKRICQSILISYYIFTMYSYDNGCGDFFKILFNKYGVIIQGFDHECEMTPFRKNPPEYFSGLIDNVPEELLNSLFNNILDLEKDILYTKNFRCITYCIWRKYSDSKWNIGNIDFSQMDNLDPDGSKEQLYIFSENYHNFVDWINIFYENVIKWIKYIFDHKPLSDELIIEINPKFSEINKLDFLKRENEKIGYPIIEKI